MNITSFQTFDNLPLGAPNQLCHQLIDDLELTTFIKYFVNSISLIKGHSRDQTGRSLDYLLRQIKFPIPRIHKIIKFIRTKNIVDFIFIFDYGEPKYLRQFVLQETQFRKRWLRWYLGKYFLSKNKKLHLHRNI